MVVFEIAKNVTWNSVQSSILSALVVFVQQGSASLDKCATSFEKIFFLYLVAFFLQFIILKL